MDNELEKVADSYYNLGIKLRDLCYKYLIKVLENNNESISWIELPEYISVCYDGGNHPEYASNAFSTVHGIKRIGAGIYLDIEDDDKYDISLITTDELYSICDFIDKYKDKLNTKYYEAN